MSLRFSTARDVFDAYPSAGADIAAPPSDVPPLAFARSLQAGPTPDDALAFLAYLLPKREAVWWACQCVRSLIPNPAAEERMALDAAETWVREPEEPHRRAALQHGQGGDRRAPATWAALAAAWSGGSMAAGGHPIPPPPDLTAKAARLAVLTALARFGPAERAGRLAACVEGGLRLAERRPGPAA